MILPGDGLVSEERAAEVMPPEFYPKVMCGMIGTEYMSVLRS